MLLAACTDRQVLPTASGPTLPATAVGALTCSVDVKAQTLTCASARPSGPRGDKIIGKQDVYVKLSSSGTSWDSGTQILSSNVVVQSLVDRLMGTSDGVTVSGVNVFFFSGPNVTSGTGTVTVANADHYDGTFMG
ncbi:MAG: hypothetical protein JO306_01590, partial [Gemmatimonadetes bacterium]|nr:hypothetical protein [Gemmatimonadota bacterium]